MKKLIHVLMVFLFVGTVANAQTLEELKSDKTAKQAMVDAKQAEIDALNAEMDALTTAIHRLSGWRTGLTGLVGFDLSGNDNWVGSPNPNATSSNLAIGISAFANKETAKTFWNNALTINKQWTDIDGVGIDETKDGLFDNAVADLLNVSSLAGYKLTDKFALSAQGELNTSVENFLEPGTLDIGIGATWLPIENMTVVVHPFNYRYAFSGLDEVTSTGSIGAKVRVDYFKGFKFAGKDIVWTTYLTGFVPYQGAADGQPSLTEYTWNNKFAFNLWNGIGVGLNYVIRNAEFEYENIQQQYGLGLTYNFIK